MNDTNFSRRVPAKKITADITAYNGLDAVTGYVPSRSEASPKSLKSAYDKMLANQKQEDKVTAQMKQASDAARMAEVEFHDAVLAMKESVRGQFGPNSDEAQAVGYKKKSEYKRRRRSA